MGKKSKKSNLRRDLGLIELFAIASGAMISSGLFILPGIAFAETGPSLILAYIIASILVIPPMFSKAELATAMPKAGGTYFFIDRSIGPMMGTVGGFAAWFSLAFKSAFALIGIGVFASLLYPNFTVFQTKIIAVLFCIIFTIINIRGVGHTGKTQIILVAGLLTLLIFYIIAGFFFIDYTRFESFVPYGVGSVFSTAGLIFVSFGGLTKICSVSEECRKPGRTIPLAMFLSWGLISLLYILVVFVTIGIVEPTSLAGSKWAISLGAGVFLGDIGIAVMAIAAILAFVSTANAGLLAASRNPMAMGKDQLLPHVFSKVSKRGTPTFSIIFTSIFMIIVILFLDLKDLVKTASLLKILLFLFVMLSLFVMRHSNIRNYRPKFKSPGYPYLHILGVIGLIFLIFQMGLIPILIVCFFILFGFLWYWFYARDNIWREYSLLHIVERLTGQKKTSYLVDEELREILIDRDSLTEKRFEDLIKNCEVVDLYKYLLPDNLARMLAQKLSVKLQYNEKRLYKLLKRKEADQHSLLHPGIAIISHTIRGRDKFELMLVRSRKGIITSDKTDPIRAFIIVVSSPDQKSFHLHTLMWIIQIAELTDFEKEWIEAENSDDLRNILLDAWKKRNILLK